MILLLLLAAGQPRVTVFTGRDATALLRQCSRTAPAPLGLWRPSEADIATAEAETATAVGPRARPPSGRFSGQFTGLADLRRRWRVEATGVTEGGRRLVYLNFVPAQMTPGGRGPTVVCDGGAQFFGAAVDLATRRVTVDFNGPG